MTRYNIGYRFEREIVNDYKARGWPVALRSAGSHSPFDVVCARGQEIHWIQAKKDGHISKAELELLIALLEEVPGRIFVASKIKGGIRYEEVSDLC